MGPPPLAAPASGDLTIASPGSVLRAFFRLGLEPWLVLLAVRRQGRFMAEHVGFIIGIEERRILIEVEGFTLPVPIPI
jgi:hypothetical protein